MPAQKPTQYMDGVEFSSDVTENVVYMQLTHEIGSAPSPATLSESIEVLPSKMTTNVTFVSRVVAPMADRMRSRDYVGTVRRRKASTIAKMIEDLQVEQSVDDLEVYVYPIVKKVKEAISLLQACEEEGNAREMLRQVRDSFLNGGWNEYKNEHARKAVVSVLKSLSASEEVTPRDVKGCFNALREAGLCLVPIGIFDVPETAKVPD